MERFTGKGTVFSRYPIDRMALHEVFYMDDRSYFVVVLELAMKFGLWYIRYIIIIFVLSIRRVKR